MKIPILLLVGAETALIATGVLFLAFHDSHNLLNTFVGAGCVIAALAILGWLLYRSRISQISESVSQISEVAREGDRIVGIGTVCHESGFAVGERQAMIEVTSVDGETFVGRLTHHDGVSVASLLRPGTVLLVAFDPAAREQLSLPDDALAVRAADLATI